MATKRLESVNTGMILPTQNVRFSSTIRVVSDEEFRRIDQDALRDRNLFVDKYSWRNRLSFATEGITTGACNCNAGGITNGQHAAIFHLDSCFSEWDPQNSGDKTPRKTREALEEDIRRLRVENPDLRAFLTGGIPGKWHSDELKTLILETFEHFGLPVSVIWGQLHTPFNDNGGGSSIHYSAETDTWTLRAGKITNGRLQTAGSLAELKKYYRDIHIDEGDQLVINGVEIPHDLANRDVKEIARKRHRLKFWDKKS